MFLLILKKQRVTREITMATIAMALGKEPDRASITLAMEKNEENIYIKDYKEFHPKDYALMTLLLNGGLDAAREALDLINTHMTNDCLKFGKLRTDLGEIRFQTDVRTIIVDIIFTTLFVRCSGVAKYLREGFFSLVNTIITSLTVSQMDKKEVLVKTLAGVEVSAMSTFFSAEQGVTSEEFLSRADYESGFPDDLKSIFIEAVQGFASPEAYRLYTFITDEKFNRGTRCHIKHSRALSVDYLPRASTCSKTLELPHYENVRTMVQKLSLATHSLDYGHA
jgi:HECT-domain (ubiquitin-transferase)